jgi:signal transduction histidine kinase
MTAQPNRNRLPQEWERIQHELPPLRVQDALVGVCLILRYAPDGAWRGRLRFITPGAADRETATPSATTTSGPSTSPWRDPPMSESERLSRLRHDLSNPLSALLAETQLLLLNEAQIDPEVLSGLREIEALAIRMRTMLREP